MSHSLNHEQSAFVLLNETKRQRSQHVQCRTQSASVPRTTHAPCESTRQSLAPNSVTAQVPRSRVVGSAASRVIGPGGVAVVEHAVGADALAG